MSDRAISPSDAATRVAALEDDLAELPIVDAHHHLWDLGAITYPWLTEPEWSWLGDYSSLQRDYLPPQYRRDSVLHNVVATVHVEAECSCRDQVAETAWLTEQNRRHGMPNAIVAHAWVDTPDTEEILARQKTFALVRGIRTKPVTAATPDASVRREPRSMQDPKWIAGLDLLRKHGLSWDLRIPWWHLEEAAEVARTHPDLPVALNHTGYPWDRSPEALAIWRRGMEALAQCRNVVCKISNFCVPGQPWDFEQNKRLILEAISIFGSDRCMFATNFPVDSLKGSWDYIMSSYKAAVAGLPMDAKRKLFADNAAQFYHIDIPA